MSSSNSTLDGLAYLLNQALANGQTYYILLTASSMSPSANMLTAVGGEMSGDGYSRLPITFSPATGTTDGLVGVLSNLVQMTATGGNIGPFNSICVVTSATGPYGAVVAYVNYDTPQTIIAGSVLSIQFPIEALPGA